MIKGHYFTFANNSSRKSSKSLFINKNFNIAQEMEARETPDLLDPSLGMTASSWPPMDMREAGKTDQKDSQNIH